MRGSENSVCDRGRALGDATPTRASWPPVLVRHQQTQSRTCPHTAASCPSLAPLAVTLNAVQDSDLRSQPIRGFFAGGGAPAAGARTAGLEFHLAAYRLMSNLRLHPS